jgi:tellurite resistance protein TerB
MFGVLGNGWARALEGAMPLSWMRAKFAEFRSQALGELANELELELSEDLVEALAAATSMVAFSDGVASPEEREELLSVFEEEERLTDIDLDDLFDAFDDYAERFAEDAKAAEGEALAAVGALDDSPDLGRLVVRAALAIASTDGTLKPHEEQAVRQLCDELGLELDELKRPVKRRTDEDDDEDEDDDADE